MPIVFAYTMQGIVLVILAFLGMLVALFLAMGATGTLVAHKITGGKSKSASCLLGFVFASVACGFGMRPQPLPPLEMTLTPPVATVAVGGTAQYSLNGQQGPGSTLDLTDSAEWKSADESIARMAKEGEFGDLRVRGQVVGVHPGSTTVSTSYQGKTLTARVVVSEAKLLSVTMSQPDHVVGLGTMTFFELVGHWSDGHQVNLTSVARWTSSDPTVVFNPVRGQAHAQKAGKIKIEASYLGFKANADLDVRN